MSTLHRVIQVHEQSDLSKQQLHDVEPFAENYEFFTPNTRAAFNPNFITHWYRRSDYFLVIVSRKASRGFGLSWWNVSFLFIIPRKNCAFLETVGDGSVRSWENFQGELVVCNHIKNVTLLFRLTEGLKLHGIGLGNYSIGIGFVNVAWTPSKFNRFFSL